MEGGKEKERLKASSFAPRIDIVERKREKISGKYSRRSNKLSHREEKMRSSRFYLCRARGGKRVGEKNLAQWLLAGGEGRTSHPWRKGNRKKSIDFDSGKRGNPPSLDVREKDEGLPSRKLQNHSKKGGGPIEFSNWTSQLLSPGGRKEDLGQKF